MRVATAFSGGFGSIEFALKYSMIPHEIVFACEYADAQRKSYLLNHGEPSSNFYVDIRDLDGTKYKGQIDYYHLSPPCQSYSLAGSRSGALDERGGLMFQAIKSIDEVQPKMFTIENVKGLLSSNGGEDWKNIMKDISSLKGYSINYGILNAKEQGTPQNRERVFIVGFRGKCNMMPFPLSVKLDKCIGDFMERNVDKKYFLSDKIIECFTAHKDKHKAKGNGFGATVKDINSYANCIDTKEGRRATNNFIIDLDQVGNIDTKGHNSLWGRVYSVDGIAPNQNANGGGAGAKTGLFAVGNGIRRLTPRECARVQGDFDDMFQFGDFSDTKLYEFIGNAIDINTAKNLISAMINHKVEFAEPQEPSFYIKKQTTTTLF